MAGYDGYSMSNNARAAYRDDTMPKTAWMREHKVPREVFELVEPDEWHHTSKKFNATDFYGTETVVDGLIEYAKTLRQLPLAARRRLGLRIHQALRSLDHDRAPVFWEEMQRRIGIRKERDAKHKLQEIERQKKALRLKFECLLAGRLQQAHKNPTRTCLRKKIVRAAGCGFQNSRKVSNALASYTKQKKITFLLAVELFKFAKKNHCRSINGLRHCGVQI